MKRILCILLQYKNYIKVRVPLLCFNIRRTACVFLRFIIYYNSNLDYFVYSSFIDVQDVDNPRKLLDKSAVIERKIKLNCRIKPYFRLK